MISDKLLNDVNNSGALTINMDDQKGEVVAAYIDSHTDEDTNIVDQLNFTDDESFKKSLGDYLSGFDPEEETRIWLKDYNGSPESFAELFEKKENYVDSISHEAHQFAEAFKKIADDKVLEQIKKCDEPTGTVFEKLWDTVIDAVNATKLEGSGRYVDMSERGQIDVELDGIGRINIVDVTPREIQAAGSIEGVAQLISNQFCMPSDVERAVSDAIDELYPTMTEKGCPDVETIYKDKLFQQENLEKAHNWAVNATTAKMNEVVKDLENSSIEDIFEKYIDPITLITSYDDGQFIPIHTKYGDMEIDTESGRLEFEGISMGGSNELATTCSELKDAVVDYMANNTRGRG